MKLIYLCLFCVIWNKEMTMIQKVMTAQKEITFQEVPILEINDDQVLLQMSHIGICRNDIHPYHRMNPFISYPVTQGHGESGEIIKIDKNFKCFH